MNFKEGQTIELKSTLSDLDGIIKTIVAFANGNGGVIYVGVNDAGKVIGASIGKGTLENLSINISRNTDPRIIPEIHDVYINDKYVIEINIKESKSKPHFFKGVAYKRSGKTDIIISSQELREMLRGQAIVSFENQIIEDFDYEDIDEDVFNAFIQKAVERRGFKFSNKKMHDIFRYLNLLSNDKPTAALVLCFSKNPSKYIPYYSIKFGVLNSDHFSIGNLIFQTDMRKPLLRVVEEAEEYYNRYMPKKIALAGFERTERFSIPLSSLREFTLNAIMHADYAISSPIYILIAKTYVEISNPGNSLLKPLSILYEKHRSVARNPRIANIFFLAGYVEQWGEGINNAISELTKNAVSFPVFKEESGFFTVRVDIQPSELSGKIISALSSPKRTIELAKMLGISERHIRNKLLILKKRGAIKASRKGKNIVYRIIGETSA